MLPSSNLGGPQILDPAKIFFFTSRRSKSRTYMYSSVEPMYARPSAIRGTE